jgi:hypothetical protein
VSSPGWDDGPYAGPPRWGPPAQQSWGPPPSYGPPGYPQPGWGWYPPQQPPRPQRPGTVIAAAAFGALLSLARGPDAGIGVGFALLQVALAGLLVVGGLRLLAGDRRWLLGAVAVQLALCAWWFVVLADLAPATFQDSVLVLPVVYVVLAGLAGGLGLLPDARAWTARPAPAHGAGG